MPYEYADVWTQTLAMIANTGVAHKIIETLGNARAKAGVRHGDALGKPTVQVLDRPSPQTVSISWCDSRTGHYGDQTWRVGVARKSGICVLSGRPIRRGEPSTVRNRAASCRPTRAR
ncbi:DUF3331 domain-containing protein [Paraburkholderia sp.]|uniref:DUF3331 domain-containing protein n=1 Tax=Paraburkholderia sp. TaxID=1926495 RepID=UPI00239CBD10|nr:DUF3331 domain-containing protein [Paraburkholderia sp.]MDE1182204.1 DUF3331 domain-containing protein [Paraburkholderia sp.]